MIDLRAHSHLPIPSSAVRVLARLEVLRRVRLTICRRAGKEPMAYYHAAWLADRRAQG